MTRFEYDCSGALWLPEHRIAVVSDAHFDKATYLARFGSPLPPYDTHETLARLSRVIERYKPLTLVFLGDSFHDANAGERMHPQDREGLVALVSRVPQVVWVLGNHDPHLPDWVRGDATEEWRAGAFTFRHITHGAGEGMEVSGHWHPKATVSRRGHVVRAPCFVSTGARLVLPAFGAFTGGLDVCDSAFAAVFGTEFDVAVCRRDAVYRFPRRELVGSN